MHFLILFIFLQPGCQAATICATMIDWNILKRTMLSKSAKKNGIYESDKDGRKSRPSVAVGWFFPLGESSRFSTRQLLCHKYAEGAAGNILFCQFHNTRGKHCRIPNTTSDHVSIFLPNQKL